jgi:hypothetical protein
MREPDDTLVQWFEGAAHAQMMHRNSASLWSKPCPPFKK